MPHREDEPLLQEAAEGATRRIRTAWAGFVDFALKDNVLEVAVGLILASAFTAIVSSLTSDVILPIVSLLPFLDRNLEEKFALLRRGRSNTTGRRGYNTVKQALDDGAVVLAYGAFVDKVVRFFIVGAALYLIARLYGWASDDSIIQTTKKCKFCRKSISQKAQRCVNCTSWQDGTHP